MKLYIHDYVDPSVGSFPATWVIECPFEEPKDESDFEIAEWFKTEQVDIFKEFAEGKIEAYYDYELIPGESK